VLGSKPFRNSGKRCGGAWPNQSAATLSGAANVVENGHSAGGARVFAHVLNLIYDPRSIEIHRRVNRNSRIGNFDRPVE
jgi:hypothetical protein